MNMMAIYFALGIVGALGGLFVMLVDDYDIRGVIAFVLSVLIIIYTAYRIWG